MNHRHTAHIHPDAQALIARLGLIPHPEGGFYMETYRSGIKVDFNDAGKPYHASTGIIFLLTSGNFSAFHRIRFDEMWHFYAGDPMEVIEIFDDGSLKTTLLGHPAQPGCICQYVVHGGVWFASRMKGQGEWALVGCTVAPGFDFADFELAKGPALISQYPEHEEIIRILTRE